MPSGTGISLSSGTSVYSAYAPSWVAYATGAPAVNAVTPSPTASTTPAPSWPGVKGVSMG